MMAVGTTMKRSPVVTGIIICVFAIYNVVDLSSRCSKVQLLCVPQVAPAPTVKYLQYPVERATIIMSRAFESNLLARFLRHVAIDTMVTRRRSDRVLHWGQWELVPLAKELTEMGIEDVLAPQGVVIAVCHPHDEGLPTVAFMAHVDTADDVPGNGVKARSSNPMMVRTSVERGRDALGGRQPGVGNISNTLIVTDGTTLGQ